MNDKKRIEDVCIDHLPEFILEYIFTMLSPYDDLDAVRLVSRRWQSIANGAIALMKRTFERCSQFEWSCYEPDLHTGPFLAERCSHSACYHAGRKAMYIFGGCTATYTAFNDLWTFDLTWHTWSRVVISRAPFPSPKALATLVPYGDDLLLYGGFSKSSPNPIHQTSTFYSELHLYSTAKNQWIEIVTENSAPKLASHSASIVGDSMIVFGGSMGNCSSNEIWVLDILGRVWLQPHIADGRRPAARYGHSQVLIDSNHLLIVGGCGGPNMIYSDAWLLHFDVSLSTTWTWHEVKIVNPEVSAPQLWCHAACRVGHNLVALSRTLRKPKPHADSRDMSIGTPPTPLNVRSALLTERRVAETVALRSGASDRRDGGLQPNTPSRRRTLLTSKSLDDQVEENVRKEIRGGSGALVASSGNTSRNVELQRARSIPAIIVGEIPTLVVTSSEATCSSSHQSPPSNPSNASYLAAKQNTDDTSDPRPLHGSTTGVSARRQGKQRDENSSSATRLMSQANRLLTTSSVSRSTERDSHSHLGVVSGSLQRRCRPGQHRSSHSSDEGHRYVHSPTGGLSGRRLLSVYILDLSHVLSEHFARWQEQDLQLNAPEDTILYSICVGRGEVIIFGGMRSDSTMEGLSPFTHSINNKTFILRPRYSI